jgi:glycosyltransferase involved in cell wall biosynthesis
MDNAMKILMIAPEPVLEPRGTPISVYQRIQGLSALGHEIDLLTYPIGADVEIPGLTIHRTMAIPGMKQIKIGPSWGKIVLDGLLFLKAIRFLMTKRYDVIHSHEEAAFFSNLLAWLFRTKHIYDMHSSLPRQLTNFSFGNNKLFVKLFQTLEKWTLNSCDALITIGSDLAEYVEKINPNVPHQMIENLAVQANDGQDHKAMASQLRQQLGLQERTLVVYTGTLESYQGIHLLLECAAQLRHSQPEVSFLLVGGKPAQLDQWRNQVSAQQLESTVRFIGAVPVDEVNSYVEMADILISPRTVGLSVPLKIYSYLHAKKPIVATAIDAHTLVLDSQSACLVEPTGQALAQGIARLVENPALARSLSTQAKILAEERYSLKHYLSRLEKIYRTLEPVTHGSTRQAHSTHD